MVIPLAVALVLAMSGTVSLAAQNTLPGDMLYPVKTQVNERVRSALAISAESQAKVDIALAVKRLIEAERLAAENRLDHETSAKLGAAFKAHADNAAKFTAGSGSADNAQHSAEIASDLESALRAHEKILAAFGNTGTADASGPDTGVSLLLGDLNAEIKDAVFIRHTYEGNIKAKNTADTNSRAAAEAKMNAASGAIAEAAKLVAAQKATFGPNAIVVVTAEKMLAEAESVFARGNANLRAGLYTEAFVDFTETLRLAREIQIYMKTVLQLKLGGGIADDNVGADDNTGSIGNGTIMPSPKPNGTPQDTQDPNGAGKGTDPQNGRSGIGSLRGHVTIKPGCLLEAQGAGMPCGMEENFIIDFSSYAVVVYGKSQNGAATGTVVARTKLDGEGGYRVELPAGSYLVRVEPHVGMGTPANDFRKVTITASTETTLNFDLDTGMR